MKVVIILTILIIGLLNLAESSSVFNNYISARVYCNQGCVGNYETVEINTGECTLLPSSKTCSYSLPYLTTIPVSTNPINYSITATVGCTVFPLYANNVTIGVCNNLNISGFVPFSILAGMPIEGTVSNTGSVVTSSFVLLSLVTFVFAL